MLELVIFDMDGLMFDTENICFHSWCKALIELGYEPDREIYISTIGTSNEDIFAKRYGKSLDLQKLSALTMAYMEDFIRREGLEPKPGLKELIYCLDAAGIKKAIASSSLRAVIMDNLAVSGIGPDFDYIISGRELERGKPHPDIFLNVCDTLGVSIENTIVLEDSLNGVRAAHAGGIHCIVVPDIVPVTQEMKEKATMIVDSLHDVAAYVKNRNQI